MNDDLVNDDHARLRLAHAGLHPHRVAAMLEQLSPSRALRRIVSGADAASEHVRAAAAVSGEERREELRTAGVAAVFRGGSAYPDRLAVRQDAPDVLFVRGTVPRGPAVAVVGTRRCTAYGTELAQAYGEAIAAAGWILVSGLARGIDGAAHRGTAAAGGRGVAVLGCGLDVAYPREHGRLGRELLELGGAIVSEYPLGTPPEPWRFPPRNRIISGLSDAVVIVEAGVTGGALITAGCALEQGIPVFAVPGDVDRETSRGTNLLIRDGAHPVLDPDDLIAELALVLGPPSSASSSTTPAPRADGLRRLIES